MHCVGNDLVVTLSDGRQRPLQTVADMLNDGVRIAEENDLWKTNHFHGPFGQGGTTEGGTSRRTSGLMCFTGVLLIRIWCRAEL